MRQLINEIFNHTITQINTREKSGENLVQSRGFENSFGAGFGQSRHKVRIMHPYQSLEACPVRLFYECLFQKWNLGISNGIKGLLFLRNQR
jgi:hypothetical protein